MLPKGAYHQSINQSINQSQCISSRTTSRLNSWYIVTEMSGQNGDKVKIRLSEKPGFQTLAENRQ